MEYCSKNIILALANGLLSKRKKLKTVLPNYIFYTNLTFNF